MGSADSISFRIVGEGPNWEIRMSFCSFVSVKLPLIIAAVAVIGILLKLLIQV